MRLSLLVMLTALGFVHSSSLLAQSQAFTIENVTAYKAACNWNGKTGTDDTAAFQSAASAASAIYASTGNPVEIDFAGNCEIAGSIVYGSGVHWRGIGGTITVPTQSGSTFIARDASDVAWDNVTINVITPNDAGGPSSSGIAYLPSNSGNALAHSRVAVRNCVINNSAWGISVFYNSGSGSLSDINISGNTVGSPTVYSNGDGIHVGGRVTGITIANNRVFNRGDAAIALTSENSNYFLSGALISQNVLLNDAVGIDMSGPSNVTVESNFVQATASSTISNPAFRVLVYGGGVPANINVIGNYFENGSGLASAASVDINGYGYTTPSNITLSGNTFSATNGSLSIRANNVSISGNTFASGALLFIDYNGTSGIPTSNVLIGTNNWLGAGTIRAGANASLIVNVQLASQMSVGTITYIDYSNFILK